MNPNPPAIKVIGLRRSPWTERALWPFDHHGIAYSFEEYRPGLDTLRTRVFARQPVGRLELPVLREGRQVVPGSFQVVMHAERVGTRARLLPDITAVVRFNRLSDQLIAAGRQHAERNLVRNRTALCELVDESVPTLLRPVVAEAVRVRLLRRLGTHGLDAASLDAAETAMRAGLKELRAALNGGAYLLNGRFSYADITMATALQFVRPVEAASGPPLGTTTRECLTHGVLAREFADLLAWRDDLYARFRVGPGPATYAELDRLCAIDRQAIKGGA